MRKNDEYDFLHNLINNKGKYENAKVWLRYIKHIAPILGIDLASIDYDIDAINKIIHQVEKNKNYYKSFHDISEIGHLKEASLYCYWLLKYRPFQSTSKFNTSMDFNIIMVMYLFLHAIKFTAENENKVVDISIKLCQEILYLFRYRDISEKAMLLLAESLVASLTQKKSWLLAQLDLSVKRLTTCQCGQLTILYKNFAIIIVR